MGPNLYNIFSNDLFFFLILDLVNYADDNSPFSCNDNIPLVLDQFGSESKTLLKWIKDNGLKANPEKFYLVLSDKSPMYCIHIGNEVIGNSANKKLLGVKIDNKFTFDNHVSDICLKVSSKLHALSRTSHFMTISQRKNVFKAFFKSQFSNCPLVWMFHSRTLNNRINHLHERSA